MTILSSLLAACGSGGSGSTPPPQSPTITSVTASCNPASVQTGQTSQCSATVSGAGNYSSTVTWAATDGTITSAGVFTPSAAGTAIITATSTQDTTKSGKASIAVATPTALSITISDLPTGVLASVTVTDPNGQITTLTSSQTITATAGTYTLTAAPVVVGTSTYHATQTTQTVIVTTGATSTAVVDYFNIVPNTTKVLDQTGAQSLVVSSDGSTLTISSASEVAQSLQPGDVLVSAPVVATPNGLLVKVVSATNSGSSVTVSSTPATLADEVTQAQFGVDIPFALSGNSAASRQRAGYEIRTNRTAVPQDGTLSNPCASAVQSLSLPFSYSLTPDQNQNTLTASGELDFCNLHVDFQITPLSTYAKATVSLQQYSSLVVQGQYSTSFDWNEPLDLSALETQVVCLGNETCQAVQGLPGSVGNALEVIAPSITPFVGMTGSASGGLYLGGTESGSFQAGAQIQGVTASPIFSGTLQQQPDAIAVDGTLDVKGYFGVTLAFTLLGSVTAHVDPRAYAELTANTSATPWWTLSLGDEADAGMTLSFLGFGSSEHDTPEYTIYSAPIAQASGPFAGQQVLSSVTPDSVAQYSSSVMLSLIGENFVPGCYVTFNGSPLATTYSGPTSLTAILPASLLGTSGSYSMAVIDSNVTGTTSNTLSFTVTASPNNPAPSITSLLPASLAAGAAPKTLTINGTGFLASSTVTFNDSSHPAMLVNAGQLTISLTTADLASPGAYPIVVTNPTPGGGSATATFTVTASTLVVSISPSLVSVPASAVQTFGATVSGGGSVTWSVQEGSAGGSITSTGIYTAPATTGTFHVIATNSANAAQNATATVNVIAAVSYTSFSPVPGSFPSASLVQGSDGSFYGTSEMNAFKLDSSGDFTQLAELSSSPDAPISSLIQASDGNFYGVDSEGDGSIFKMDSSGNVTVLYSFPSPTSGTTSGLWPWAGLVQGADGNLYGTTYAGGDLACTPYGWGMPAYGPFNYNPMAGDGCGTVFKMDLSGNVTILYSFSGQSDGNFPQAPLIQGSDGSLYGTSSGGGAFGYGAVFKMSPSGNLQVLYSFTSSDGDAPVAALAQASDGYLYGTAACVFCAANGNTLSGEIFKIDTSGNNFTVLHSFAGPDGSLPVAPLIQGPDGSFYGTTWAGGDLTCGSWYFSVGSNYPYPRLSGCGTVFKMDSAGDVTVLHNFEEPQSGDGNDPYAGLLFGKDGYLYGTTYYGGTSIYFGTVFRLSVP